MENYFVIDERNRKVHAFMAAVSAVEWRDKHEPSPAVWSVVTWAQADKAGLKWAPASVYRDAVIRAAGK